MYLKQVLQKLRNRYFITVTKMVLNLTKYCVSWSVALLPYPEASNWFYYSDSNWHCELLLGILAAFKPYTLTLSLNKVCSVQVSKKTEKWDLYP